MSNIQHHAVIFSDSDNNEITYYLETNINPVKMIDILKNSNEGDIDDIHYNEAKQQSISMVKLNSHLSMCSFKIDSNVKLSSKQMSTIY